MQTERIVASWLRTRLAMRQTAPELARRREQLWQRLQPVLARTPALAAHAGQPLLQVPITDSADTRDNYGAWNSVGKSHAELRALADAAETGRSTGILSAGWSSGSSGGTRGLFVSSPAERADYIGQSLARLLPAAALLRRQRIALHLRSGNALYSDVQRGRIEFRHFALDPPAEATAAQLRDFAPTILIAPPHRLIAFAVAGLTLPSLCHLFYGSEPMSDAERAVVAEHLSLLPRAIYQATEGFLGADCAEGRLHLNDHSLAIELEPVPGTSGFRPIITDLRRTSQPIVRLRSDDYLEIDSRACPCGYAGRVIAPLAGRVGDLWRFDDRCIAPTDVVAAVEGAIGATCRWQAVARPDAVVLRVAADAPPGRGAGAAAALTELTGRPVTLCADLPPWTGPKRRKVVWDDG
jgi:putative adenylate-forming enzyme